MSVIRHLVREYDDFKIEILDWRLPERGIVALKGPSGSGKTSVIRLLLGLDECESLEWVFGEVPRGTTDQAVGAASGQALSAAKETTVDVAKLPVEQRRLGVVFQNYELFHHMTARENIEFAIRARKLDKAPAMKRLQELAQGLSMQSYLDRPARVLSGGEKQRVALARALVGQPRFLFLDEPFSALDVDLRSEARVLVKQMIAAYRVPTLLVSHDEQDIRELAQTTVHIRNGRLIHT